MYEYVFKLTVWPRGGGQRTELYEISGDSVDDCNKQMLEQWHDDPDYWEYRVERKYKLVGS